MRRVPNEHKANTTVFLYRLVFGSRKVFAACFVLLLSIVIQPFEYAFASEEVLEQEEIEVVEPTEEPEPEPEPDTEVEEGVVEEESSDEDNNVDESDIDEEVSEVIEEEIIEDDESTEEVIDDQSDSSESQAKETEEAEDGAESELEDLDEEVSVGTEDSSTSTSTEGVTDVEVSTSSVTSAEGSESTSSASSTDPSTSVDVSSSSGGGDSGTVSEAAGEPVASTTSDGTSSTTIQSDTTDDVEQTESSSSESESNDDQAEQTETKATSTSSSNQLSNVAGTSTSSKDSATSTPSTATSTDSASEGSQVVYVTEESGVRFDESACVSVGNGAFYCSEEVQDSSLDLEDDLYSAPDGDGDMEIYIRINGVESKLTDNLLDDKAPEYDGVSNTIVWHRLVNDRYHIIQYDYETGEEEQLTTGNQNNMEPSVYGDVIVWQAWDGNDWEIALYQDEEIEFISDNQAQDIGPMVNNEYVIWNVNTEDQGQIAQVYNLKTQKLETITDHDGGHVANPRFVLVYDTMYDNGDVVTRGLDLESGRVEPLSALPGELPSEIPPVDQTGETRALITNKNLNGRDEVELDDDVEPVTPVSTSSVSAIATSTNTEIETISDLVIDNSGSTTEEIAPGSHPDVLDTEPATTTNEYIDDVVIPPFSASTTEETS